VPHNTAQSVKHRIVRIKLVIIRSFILLTVAALSFGRNGNHPYGAGATGFQVARLHAVIQGFQAGKRRFCFKSPAVHTERKTGPASSTGLEQAEAVTPEVRMVTGFTEQSISASARLYSQAEPSSNIPAVPIREKVFMA
jgi:hypothetical protein